MPPGFPKGQVTYTTAKVIVARAFPPHGATWRHASKPFDPEQSGHATPVAGLAGNAPELVAAIEAAVADGMDVINLSLGEPEIEPARDVVALALDAAAAAGGVSG